MIDRKNQLSLFGKAPPAAPAPPAVTPTAGVEEAPGVQKSGGPDRARPAVDAPTAPPASAPADLGPGGPDEDDWDREAAADRALDEGAPAVDAGPPVLDDDAPVFDDDLPAGDDPGSWDEADHEAEDGQELDDEGAAGPAGALDATSEAVLPGLPPPTGAQFLFPPSEERRRVDMHFSRRMSDLIRRLQLLERESKAELDLTLPQAHAIHALDAAGSLRMQELAATLGLAQSTVTRLVAPLKRVGLLDRRPDRNDGRATRAFLTDEGKRAVDRLEQADRDLYRALLDRIPPTRRAEVVAAVELLHEVVLAVARGEE